MKKYKKYYKLKFDKCELQQFTSIIQLELNFYILYFQSFDQEKDTLPSKVQSIKN